MELIGGVRRLIRACGRRVADGDPDDLARLVALRSELDVAIQTAVTGLRRDWTWDRIGEATGTTRQAALMKWGQVARDAGAAGPRKAS